jgi:hypothetical protein
MQVIAGAAGGRPGSAAMIEVIEDEADRAMRCAIFQVPPTS